MAEEDPDDSIIKERQFRLSPGTDVIDLEYHQDEVKEEEVPEEDEALGDVYDPFVDKASRAPGAIQQDGTVASAPERDLVTELSIEGERRINWILMASMVVVYSAISIQVGRTFDPALGTLSLIFLASIGFGLGEYWVPREKMTLLGVTWVIISMKILYGLAIELRQWEVIPSDLVLGISLLLLVGLNIFVAFRHDQDAIAAQSTLVLFAIGSTAGTEFGEEGIAGMILLATILVHVLALNRKSGNLASLGIASSNLWIGMHAVTSGFEVGQLRVLPLQSPLLLFMLLMIVTALNAIMAARFAREENWFSKGFETVGLGKPGLWGVSISLGMIGAMMAVASNRDDIGYALGMITFLGGAFGGSYLVVRGVEKRRVGIPLLASGAILSLFLLGEQGFMGVSPYEVFTVIGAITTGAVILRDQNSVTDRVLWIGSVVILAILTIIIPAEATDSGGDGGVLLLSLLSALHIGTAVLAVRRSSASLSGVTVLLPWTWIMVEEIIQETYRTLMLANNNADPEGIVVLSPEPLALYLALSCVLLFVVNLKMGENGVNLASGFLGITEVSSSIRDSGALQLWSLGLWLPSLTILFMAQFGGFDSITILCIVALLAAIHVSAQILGFRKGGGSGIMSIVAFITLVIQWRHGLDQGMMAILCITISSLLVFGKKSEGEFSLGMVLFSLPVLVAITNREASLSLQTPNWFSELIGDLQAPGTVGTTVVCTAAIIAVYLPMADKMEKIIQPAASALGLLVVTCVHASLAGSFVLLSASVAMFAFTSVWLIGKGEVRSELKSIARRDSMIGSISEGASSGSGNGNEGLDSYNPKVAELADYRKRQRQLSDTDDMGDIMATDVSHRPVVGLTILAIVMTSTVIFGSIYGTKQDVWLPFLLSSGTFSALIVLLVRNRTRGLELDLPHVLGMEMPIAFSIVGLNVALVTAHIIPAGSSYRELLDLALVSIVTLLLVLVSLVHQKNLLDRISIAIDWLVMPLLAARILGAVMAGGFPMPLAVDPLEGELLEWRGPWLVIESILILCVITNFWVEEQRAKLGREGTSGGFGLGSRAFAVVFLSFGPAGILAAMSACYRSWKDSFPTGLGLALPAGMFAIIAISYWNMWLFDVLFELVLSVGLLLIVSCTLTVPLKMEKWTITLAMDGHIFVIVGALGMGLLYQIEMPILLISMSTAIWIVGILQLRKSLRIWGLADLVTAVLCSLVFVASEIAEPQNLLIGLAVLALELGIVAWLGTAMQEDMIRD